MLIGVNELQAVNCNIVLNKNKLEIVQNIKYLGVILDNKLTFKQHIERTLNKITHKVNYFQRISQSLNLSSRVQVYNTIIAPHFKYCPTILYFIDYCDMHALQKQQNRAMRIILRCDRYTPIRTMLECLNYLTVENYLLYQCMCFLFKLFNNMLPEYLSCDVVMVKDVHSYSTRNCDNIYIKTTKKECTRRTLFCEGMSIYNALPREFKESKSLHMFKNKLLPTLRI